MNLADIHWTAVPEGALLLVPTGSCEQHGPHLPMDADTRIATAVAERTGAVVAPAIPYGASGEHEEFPGTISIGTEALRTVLVEYGRSACRWAERVLFVNAHGGNATALVEAVTLLRSESRDVAWFACRVPDGDAHAGQVETSLLLDIAPHTVRIEHAEPGNTAPLAELMPRLRAGQLRAASPTGVLGDPIGATMAAGAKMRSAMVLELRGALARWEPDERGRLT